MLEDFRVNVLKCRERGKFQTQLGWRWLNNKENNQKMPDNAYLFRVYMIHTSVSLRLSCGFIKWTFFEMLRIVDLVVFFS